MIREPVVAGTFYPDDPEVLSRTVSGFIGNSGIRPDPLKAGLVSPHAGFVYSGAVAGAAFASAPDGIETVVLVAPPHRYPVRGCSVFDGEGCRTPLGIAAIDREVTSALLEAGCSFQEQAHAAEHSAEVLLPFVQVRWPDAEITIVLQGDSSRRGSSILGDMMAAAFSGRSNTMVIASSDLSHYHSQSLAVSLDRSVIEGFCSGSPDILAAVLREGSGEACGGGPMLTLMYYAIRRGCSVFGETAYDTSATASGDRSAVVGYFAGYTAFEGGTD